MNTSHTPVPPGINDPVTSPPRELTLCCCERARGDAGCNCGTIDPPLEDRIDGFFREIQDALAALREAV